MNPDTNRFEPVSKADPYSNHKLMGELYGPGPNAGLYRADGSPVPANWKVFSLGELVEVKGYTYRVAYLNESSITLEPVGPMVLGVDPAGSPEKNRHQRRRDEAKAKRGK